MKIIIEEIGDHIAISFTGKGKKSDRIKLLMMVMVEHWLTASFPT